MKYEYNSWVYSVHMQKTTCLGGSITQNTYCYMYAIGMYVSVSVDAYNTQLFTALPHVLDKRGIVCPSTSDDTLLVLVAGDAGAMGITW